MGSEWRWYEDVVSTLPRGFAAGAGREDVKLIQLYDALVRLLVLALSLIDWYLRVFAKEWK